MAISTARQREIWAADPARTHGRIYPEPASPARNDFRRDCDRIIHSTAFRRLKHKTQVFVWHEGDHYRTRLTHTMEVQQIARSLARALGLDEDLSEGLALAHDLGHTPFGHAGERALNAAMQRWGGFDHNVQSLRIVTSLEKRYPQFDGLNLTRDMLDGLIKHNGPLPSGHALYSYADLSGLDLSLWPTLEAQVSAISDDIAYNTHDIDDGVRAGLFDLDDLQEVAFLAEVLAQIETAYPQLEAMRRQNELIRRLITLLIEDVVRETDRRITQLQPRGMEDILHAGQQMCGFSPSVMESIHQIRAFLHPRMYRHPEVMKVMHEAEHCVTDLFGYFLKDISALPPEWARGLEQADDPRRARRIADYIAGMTDRYALNRHRELQERGLL